MPTGGEPARRGCRPGSWPGSRGRAAPARSAGRRPRRADASRTSGGACAAIRPRAAGATAQQVEPVAQPADAERLAAVVQEQLGRRRGIGRGAASAREQLRATVFEVGGDRGTSRPSEQPDPLLAALAVDPQLAAAQVEQADLRSGQLADPEPRGIGGLDERPVAEAQRHGQPATRIARAPAAARSSSITASRRSICSTSSTRGSRRGRRGVAIAAHGSPGASSARARPAME